MLIYEASRSSPHTKSTGTSILDFHSLQNYEIDFLLLLMFIGFSVHCILLSLPDSMKEALI